VLLILANVKITGIMQKSNEVARSMAQLMKVEQFQTVSAQFTKELIKVNEYFCEANYEST